MEREGVRFQQTSGEVEWFHQAELSTGSLWSPGALNYDSVHNAEYGI